MLENEIPKRAENKGKKLRSYKSYLKDTYEYRVDERSPHRPKLSRDYFFLVILHNSFQFELLIKHIAFALKKLYFLAILFHSFTERTQS